MKKGLLLGLSVMIISMIAMAFMPQAKRIYYTTVCDMSSQSVAEQVGQYGVDLAYNTYGASSASYSTYYNYAGMGHYEWCVRVTWDMPRSLEVNNKSSFEQEMHKQVQSFLSEKMHPEAGPVK